MQRAKFVGIVRQRTLRHALSAFRHDSKGTSRKITGASRNSSRLAGYIQVPPPRATIAPGPAAHSWSKAAERLMLDAAESFFALAPKKLGDALARALLYLSIEIAKGDAQPLRRHSSQRGLAAAHEAGEINGAAQRGH